MEKIETKILIIGERFFPEEFLINDVVKFLQDNGCACTIITHQPSYPTGTIYEGYKNNLFSESNYSEAKVHRVSFINGYNKNVILKIVNYIWFVIWGIYLVFFRIKEMDKILVYQTGPLTQACIGIAAKWRFKKPLYIWTWDIWPDSVFGFGFRKNLITKTVLNVFVKFIYRRCDAIWVSSPGFRQVIKRYTDKVCIDVPNWVMQPENTCTGNLDFKEGFHFTFTGNVGKVQNLENVILGFQNAFSHTRKVYLNIVGDGSYLNSLMAMVQNEKINNVIFWGKRPYNEMNAFYAKSNVLIISLKAGSVWNLYLPSKFQSYLDAKIPVFGIIEGTVKELIEEYKLGICSSPDDIIGISNSFIKIFENYQMYKDEVLKNSGNLAEEYDGTNIKSYILNELIS